MLASHQLRQLLLVSVYHGINKPPCKLCEITLPHEILHEGTACGLFSEAGMERNQRHNMPPSHELVNSLQQRLLHWKEYSQGFQGHVGISV